MRRKWVRKLLGLAKPTCRAMRSMPWSEVSSSSWAWRIRTPLTHSIGLCPVSEWKRRLSVRTLMLAATAMSERARSRCALHDRSLQPPCW
jgi:hypothetical protein